MSIQPANRVNSVKEYYFSTKLREVQQLRLQGKDIINLYTGIIIETFFRELFKPHIPCAIIQTSTKSKTAFHN